MSTKKIKLHGMTCKLRRDLGKTRGMLYHNEDFIERDHQERKRHDRQVKCLRAYGAKQEHFVRDEGLKTCEEVTNADTQYKQKRRRQNRRSSHIHADTEARIEEHRRF